MALGVMLSAASSSILARVALSVYIVFTCLSCASADIRDVLNSVCLLQILDENGQIVGTGSAVICSSKGLAVTCYHVIAGARSVKARLHDGKELIVRGYYQVDKDKDFAVIQLDTKASLSPANIGDLSKVKVGDRVFTVGNPSGWEGSVADGVVSAIREIEGFGAVIQTSAAISPGSSGGALVTADGNLIGLTSFYWRESQNLNFAIAIDSITPFLKEGVLHMFHEAPLSMPLKIGPPDVDAFFSFIAEPGSDEYAMRGVGDVSFLAKQPETLPVYVIALAYSGAYDKAIEEVNDFYKKNSISGAQRETVPNMLLALAYTYSKRAQFERDLGNQLEAKKYCAKAAVTAIRVLKVDDKDIFAWGVYLQALYGSEDWAGWEEMSNKAVRTLPEQVFLWKSYMGALVANSKFDDAIAVSDRLLRRDDAPRGTVFYVRGLIWKCKLQVALEGLARAQAEATVSDLRSRQLNEQRDRMGIYGRRKRSAQQQDSVAANIPNIQARQLVEQNRGYLSKLAQQAAHEFLQAATLGIAEAELEISELKSLGLLTQ